MSISTVDDVNILADTDQFHASREESREKPAKNHRDSRKIIDIMEYQ